MNDRTNEIVPERRTSDFSPKTIRDFHRVKTAPVVASRDTAAVPISPVSGAVRRILTPLPPRSSAAGEQGRETVQANTSLGAPEKPPVWRDEAVGTICPPAFALGMFAAVGFVVFGALAFGVYKLGESVGLHAVPPVEHRDAVARAEFTKENLQQLDAALQLLRDHDGVGAFQALQNLAAENPKAPSIRYAAAMAAMVADYRNDARRLLEASISDGDRVSDSLAMKAAIEPTATREMALRSAIAADPMNPYPFLELANVLRSLGRADEALPVLKSAKLRLLPADSHAVVDTTLALLKLEQEESPDVPEQIAATGIAERDFPAAYSLLKQENFDAAAALLSETEKQISPDLFNFLINDPAMRKFARQPAIAVLYR